MYFSCVAAYIYKQENILIMQTEQFNLIDLSIPFQHSQTGLIIQNQRHDMIGSMRDYDISNVDDFLRLEIPG